MVAQSAHHTGMHCTASDFTRTLLQDPSTQKLHFNRKFVVP